MGNAPNRTTAAARLHLWRCKAVFPLSSPASSCDCLQCRGVSWGTRPAAQVQRPPLCPGKAGCAVLRRAQSTAFWPPQARGSALRQPPHRDLRAGDPRGSCKTLPPHREWLRSPPPKTRAYLDSLVVTSADSWFAASQSQASACAASPPSCSLMHLEDTEQCRRGCLRPRCPALPQLPVSMPPLRGPFRSNSYKLTGLAGKELLE